MGILNNESILNSKFYIQDSKVYQLLFFTPGISPLLAISLKHIRHKLNFLIKPLLLPHLKQRRIILVLNLGFFLDFTICDFLAMFLRPAFAKASAELSQYQKLNIKY